jgi:hypothetical protein
MQPSLIQYLILAVAAVPQSTPAETKALESAHCTWTTIPASLKKNPNANCDTLKSVVLVMACVKQNIVEGKAGLDAEVAASKSCAASSVASTVSASSTSTTTTVSTTTTTEAAVAVDTAATTAIPSPERQLQVMQCQWALIPSQFKNPDCPTKSSPTPSVMSYLECIVAIKDPAAMNDITMSYQKCNIDPGIAVAQASGAGRGGFGFGFALAVVLAGLL